MINKEKDEARLLLYKLYGCKVVWSNNKSKSSAYTWPFFLSKYKAKERKVSYIPFIYQDKKLCLIND